MRSHVSQSGDVLDAICRDHYGAEDRIAVVLDANPGLADHGPVLPAGVTIRLPERPDPEAAPKIRLWG